MSEFRYVIFILSYGRPTNVKTLNTLKRCGYKGDYYIVCSMDDAQLSEYQRIYKGKVICFDKESVPFDRMDNFGNLKCVVYARNVCKEIVKQFEVDGYLVLDDDYICFSHVQNVNGKKKEPMIKDLDAVNLCMFQYLQASGATTIAMIQGGDLVGGENAIFRNGFKRKAMNAFYFLKDSQYEFTGTLNEDVNFYTEMGRQGEFILSIAKVKLNQEQTQKSKGGMTDIYLDGGTYIKSFYSVMRVPSAVKIGVLNDRIHHNVEFKFCTACVIDEKYKKR